MTPLKKGKLYKLGDRRPLYRTSDWDKSSVIGTVEKMDVVIYLEELYNHPSEVMVKVLFRDLVGWLRLVSEDFPVLKTSAWFWKVEEEPR